MTTTCFFKRNTYQELKHVQVAHIRIELDKLIMRYI